MPIPPGIIRTGRPKGAKSSYSPGWLRKQVLDEMRRRGVRNVTGELKTRDLMDYAVKLEPKDINTQTNVNIKIVSIPSKRAQGQAIEPADYKVIDQPVLPARAIEQPLSAATSDIGTTEALTCNEL